jgi:3'-phosphoadenosine 5'-phosphosulfate sulfotransferase (PAPS reductase)/FAD synthetase
MEQEKTLLVSFSGGRTSAFMLKLIFEADRYKDFKKVVLFANTSKEKEETLIFVKQVSENFNIPVIWLEAKIHPEKGVGTTFSIASFKEAKREGELYTEMINKYGLPSSTTPFCTRELKQQPMVTYMKSLGLKNWSTAVGIRKDELHRKKQANQRLKNPIYPLIDLFPCDERFIRSWWNRQTFDLKLKDYQGNCDLCFKKSLRKKLTLLAEEPELASYWNEQELKNGKGGLWIFNDRHHLSIAELLAKSKEPFNKAIDKQELRERGEQMKMFEPDLDLEFACFCKSS